MSTHTDRSDLEDRLRSELHREAQGRWPTQPAPPLRLPADRDAVHRSWGKPILAAVAAAAVVGVTYTLVADHQSTHTHTLPAAHSTPTASSATNGYPEADTVPGVRVENRPSALGPVTDFTHVVPTSLRKTLRTGQSYSFVARLGYQAMSDDADTPYVLSVSSATEDISCAGPFIVRSGHTYDITCTLVPSDGPGTVTFFITGVDGSARAGDDVPITAR